MSMFKKYLNIITESNNDIITRIKDLKEKDIKELDEFDNFNSLYYDSENDKLKQIAYLYATDVPDDYYEGNFESFKKFILDNKSE